MIVTGNIAAWRPPLCPSGTGLVAAVDVEWTKNYRIKNGNMPFCFSVTWLALPVGGRCTMTERTLFWYRSAYVEHDAERGELIAAAGSALECLARHASLISGHQLCSDLAVLAAAPAGPEPAAVQAAASAWRQRQHAQAGQCRYLDTRYDAGDILTGRSRRLVDVCTELGLDVTQPELRGTSMTALHRRWLQQGDTTAREKITVLNVRHSLSTTLVAARAAGLASWQPGLNVNRLLASQLDHRTSWITDPVFAALLGEPGAA